MKKTKSLLAILLACMMVVSCIVVTTPVVADEPDVWDGTTDTSWYNGSDTTFTLTTAEQLAGFATLVNGGNKFSGKTVKLGADIVLNSDDVFTYDENGTVTGIADGKTPNLWMPISYYSTADPTYYYSFNGTFDGQGHTISGMYANGSNCSGRPALFGYVNGATITNFTIEYSYSTASSCPAIIAAFHSGTAPAFSNITISNCAVKSTNGGSDGAALLMCKMGGFGTLNISDITVEDSTIDGTYNAGALIGYLSGGNMTAINISGCNVSAAVNSTTGTCLTGGIIGKIGSGSGTLTTLSFTSCEFNPTMKGTRNFGGVIGDVCKQTVGNILFDHVEIDVDIDAHDFAANIAGIGGVIGYFRPNQLTGKVSFKNSSVTGTIKAGQNSGILIGWQTSAGTFVAHNEIEVINSTFDVDFIGKAGTGSVQCNGGIIGLAQKVITTLTVDDVETSNNWSSITATGTLLPDGKNKNSNSQFAALVGSDSGITNVSITDSTFNDTYTDLGNYIGGLFASTAAYPNLTISGVTVGGSISGGDYVGGIFARISSSSTDPSCSDVTITADLSGLHHVGGVIGQTTVTIPSATFTNVNFAGTITATGSSSGVGGAGGIIGTSRVLAATFDSCSCTGTVSGVKYVGGFVGDVMINLYENSVYSICDYEFTDCYVDASITASTFAAGGFIGDYDPGNGNAAADNRGDQLSGQFEFTNCLVMGTRSAGSSGGAGGLIGRIYPKNSTVDIDKVLVLGNTTVSSGSNKGAIIGVFGTAYTLTSIINIDNFYYNGMTGGKLAPFDPTSAVGTCNFWTPGTDNTTDFSKQDNDTIDDFVEATRSLDFGIAHYNTPVVIDGTTVLGCEIPGCSDYKVDRSADYWDDWDGTSDNDSWKTKESDGYYHIKTAEQLANLAAEINEGSSGTWASSSNFYQNQTIKLDYNIRLNSTTDIASFATWGTSAPALTWTPIGSYDSAQGKFHSFNGTFDGQGHVIEGMYCAPTASSHAGTRYAFIGIPGELIQVKNLTFNKAYVTGSGNGIGIVMGQMANTHSDKDPQTVAQDITITNSVLKSTGSGGAGAILGRTGGIVAQTLVFDNCDVTNSSLSASAWLGGIFGYHGSGDFYGRVEDKTKVYHEAGFTFKNCDFSGNTLTANQNVGGFMAGSYTLADNSTGIVTFQDCTSDSRIVINSVTAGNQSAGIVAYFDSAPKSIVIDGCEIGGNIDVLQNSGVFIGRIGTGNDNADVSITVTDSVSTANLTANVMRDGINSGAVGVVIGLFQSVSGTNVASLTIDGLTCSGTFNGSAKAGNTYGIIGSVGPAITNLDISNVTSSLDIIGAGSTIGGVVADCKGTNATFDNVAIHSDITGVAGVGGLMARGSFTNYSFNDCTFDGTVTGSSDSVAGFIGWTNVAATSIEFTNVTVDAAISTTKTGSAYVGGLVGYVGGAVTDFTVDGATISGSISGAGIYEGGLYAYNNNPATNVTVTDVTVTADITGQGEIGGLIGASKAMNLTAENVIMEGTITATSESGSDNHIGGLIADIMTALSTGNVCDYSFTNCAVKTDLANGRRYAGGFIGDYDPGNGNTVADADEGGNSAGSFTFTNCLYMGDVSASVAAGGLFGRVYPKNVSITVDKAFVIGECGNGAIAGNIGSAATASDFYNINNFYYNGMASGKLLPSWNAGGKHIVERCIFWTPGSDSTSGIPKQGNITLLQFLEATKTVDFSGLTHVCTPVDMSQESTANPSGTMTLGCEIPGCTNHHITSGATTVGECFGGSIRPNDNGLRFGFRMDNVLKEGDKETINIGVLLIPTSSLGEEELTVNTVGVQNVRAEKVFRSSSVYYVDGTISFSAVLLNIPAKHLNTKISARAYIQVGDTVYYSRTVSASYNDIAG